MVAKIRIYQMIYATKTQKQGEIRNLAKIAPDTANAPFFTGKEMDIAGKTFKNDKTLGIDLIEIKVLKISVREIPEQFLRLFNGCLQWGVFPKIWKEGSLRVLLKGEDKDVKDPKSNRPICLLPVIGKLFEKLLKMRLTDTALAPMAVSVRTCLATVKVC